MGKRKPFSSRHPNNTRHIRATGRARATRTAEVAQVKRYSAVGYNRPSQKMTRAGSSGGQRTAAPTRYFSLFRGGDNRARYERLPRFPTTTRLPAGSKRGDEIELGRGLGCSSKLRLQKPLKRFRIAPAIAGKYRRGPM